MSKVSLNDFPAIMQAWCNGKHTALKMPGADAREGSTPFACT